MLLSMNHLVLRGSRFWRPFAILDPIADLPVGEGEIVLTFDDGPVAQGDITLRLLEVLAAEEVTACFCVIGSIAEKRASLLREVHAGGHCLVNHGYHHIPPMFQQTSSIADEIARTDAVIASVTGGGALWFRPPGGLILGRQRKFVEGLGKLILPLSFFALDTETKSHTAEALVNRCVGQLNADGRGIVVFHEQKFLTREEVAPREWLPQAVTAFIQRAKAAGLRFTAPRSDADRGCPSLSRGSERLRKTLAANTAGNVFPEQQFLMEFGS
jgi:peptidoglycan/xylan/chitin deacetylase (PgdA/CDA1 family)